MSIFERVKTAIERVWATYPFIGILLLFIGIGFGVYQSGQANRYARQAKQQSAANGTAIKGQLAAKDATIAAKDAQILDLQRQLAAKDAALTGLTLVTGQIYSAAVALQQQVTALGGQPKTIPVTLPKPTVLSPPGTSSPPAATPSPTPSRSPALNLQVQCPIICPPQK